mmetsp:Transcript_21778/g.60537  ORF Transcript_21778/g.60537 Transcript_21778/m.60537 type:complete len:274 (-) Transcript_21778:94-915(-)
MDRFSVVLARAASPGNVGAVSRLCGNFGCRRICLVSPGFDFQAALAEGLTGEMGWYSRHQGLQLLQKSAAVEQSLVEAVGGCTRVLGFSRRRGRHRSGLPQLQVGSIYSETRADSDIALLFGNESDGLTTEELSFATDIVEIPTASSQGSMNLSHAVGVGLGRVFDDCVAAGEWEEMLGGEVTVQSASEVTVKSTSIGDSLATVEDLWSLQRRFARLAGEEQRWPARLGRGRWALPDSELLSRILLRARPTKAEVRYIHGLLQQAEDGSLKSS